MHDALAALPLKCYFRFCFNVNIFKPNPAQVMQSIRRRHTVHGDSAKMLLPSFSLMETIFPVFMQNLQCIISECIRLLSEEKH